MGRLLERLQTKERATRQVAIPLNDAVVQAAAKAELKLNRTTVLGSEAEQDEARVEAEAAREALKAATEIITVQALSADEWEALQREHPPTAEEVELARKENGPYANVAWNGKTFLPAAWARCQVVAPDDEPLTAGECETVLKLFGPGEQIMLLRAIQEVHNSSISVESLGE